MSMYSIVMLRLCDSYKLRALVTLAKFHRSLCYKGKSVLKSEMSLRFCMKHMNRYSLERPGDEVMYETGSTGTCTFVHVVL